MHLETKTGVSAVIDFDAWPMTASGRTSVVPFKQCEMAQRLMGDFRFGRLAEFAPAPKAISGRMGLAQIEVQL